VVSGLGDGSENEAPEGLRPFNSEHLPPRASATVFICALRMYIRTHFSEIRHAHNFGEIKHNLSIACHVWTASCTTMDQRCFRQHRTAVLFDIKVRCKQVKQQRPQRKLLNCILPVLLACVALHHAEGTSTAAINQVSSDDVSY
jgi:hypothetical protein